MTFGSATSCSKVFSSEYDFASRYGSTSRSSSPRASRAALGPKLPSRRRSSVSARRASSPIVAIPARRAARHRTHAPDPADGQRREERGDLARWHHEQTGSGLATSLAIFATSLTGASPTDTASPVSARTTAQLRAVRRVGRTAARCRSGRGRPVERDPLDRVGVKAEQLEDAPARACRPTCGRARRSRRGRACAPASTAWPSECRRRAPRSWRRRRRRAQTSRRRRRAFRAARDRRAARSPHRTRPCRRAGSLGAASRDRV